MEHPRSPSEAARLVLLLARRSEQEGRLSPTVLGQEEAAAVRWWPHDMRHSAQSGLAVRLRAGRPTAGQSAVARRRVGPTVASQTGWLTESLAHVGEGWGCLPACSSRRLSGALAPLSLPEPPASPARQGLCRLPSAPFDPTPSAAAPLRGRAPPMLSWTVSAAGAAWGWPSSTLFSSAVACTVAAEPVPGPVLAERSARGNRTGTSCVVPSQKVAVV